MEMTKHGARRVLASQGRVCTTPCLSWRSCDRVVLYCTVFMVLRCVVRCCMMSRYVALHGNSREIDVVVIEVRGIAVR